MARWASWMVLVALVGCTADAFAQDPPVQRAPALVPEIQQEALRENPPPDIRVARRRFARAVENFAVSVRRIATNVMPPSDRDLAQSIELFARALESAPYAEAVGASRAATEMRAAVRDASLLGPPGSPPARRALADALYIGTDVLLDLAYGPYFEDSRDLTARAWQLENTLYGPKYDYPPSGGEYFTVVLRQSVFVMKALLETTSEPPPPPPHPPPRRYRSW